MSVLRLECEQLEAIMAVEIAISFLVGGFVGSFFGMLVLSLGIMAKRNVSDMPEVPIATWD